MNYLLKSKPKSGNRRKFLLIIFFYIILTLAGLLFGDTLRRMFWATARPIWATSSFITSPFSSIKNYFTFKTTIINENLMLEEQLEVLKAKELDYDILLRENQSLKDELGRQSNSERVLSAILSKPPRSPYDTLVIDAGSEDGIGVGSKVYVGENIIVGLVTNITPHTSLVNMFSTGGHLQDVTLARTGASFTIKGKSAQNFELEVPKDTDIIWGDTFIYPGISQGVVATVYFIDTSSQSSFKTVYLKIPTNIFSTKYVFVQEVN